MKSRISKLLSMLCVFAMLISIVPMPKALADDVSYTASFGGASDKAGSVPAGTIYTITKGSSAPGFANCTGTKKITVNLDGVDTDFFWALKMESSTKISFTAPGEGTLTLYCNSGSAGNTIMAKPFVDDVEGVSATLTVAQDAQSNYTASLETAANTAYELTKGTGGAQVVYIEWKSASVRATLTSAVTAAEVTAAEWADKVSADGNDVPNTDKWIAQADLDAYNTAIQTAKTALDNAEATDEALAAAKTALDTAAASFKAAQKQGLAEPVAGELTYTLTATQKDFTPMGDKDLIPKGPVFLSPYFTANWDEGGNNEGLQYRAKSGSNTVVGNCALEVGKAAGKNGLEFTVESTATVVITFCSTDVENVSVIGLQKDGALVAYDSFTGAAEDVSTVAGTGAKTVLKCGNGETGSSGTGTDNYTVTYTDLAAGTYRICSPTMPAMDAGTAPRLNYTNRGVRLREVEVTETSALAKAELTPVAPTGVKLENYTHTSPLRLAVGEELNLVMVLEGAGAGETYGSRSGATWASSSETVAKVELPQNKKVTPEPGTVTAVAPGRATISVTINGLTAQVEVEVYEVTKVDVTCSHGFAHHDVDLRGDTISAAMKAAVTPANAAETGVTWSISPEGKGVTIDADGVVTVLPTADNVTYTVTAKSKEANSTVEGTATLDVRKPVIKSFGFEGGNGDKTIKMGQELDLTVLTEWFKATEGAHYIAPAEGTASAVDWEVSDPSVVALDSGENQTDGKAVVTPKKVGEVNITATSQRDETKTATLKVTVEKGDVDLTIQARNNEVSAAGNTIELLVSGMPDGVDPVVTIERNGDTGTTSGTATVAKQDSTADGKAWNYRATLPQNTHTTEDLVYTVTAGFAGDDNWNAATDATVELKVRNTGAKIIRITAYPNGGSGVTITSGQDLDMTVEAEMRETNPDGSVGQVVGGADGALTYTWAKVGGTADGTSTGNNYKKTGALVADGGTYTCTISATNAVGVNDAVANITVRVNKKTVDAPEGVTLETNGRVLGALDTARAAHPDSDAGLEYSLDNGSHWTGVTIDGEGEYHIPPQDNPVAVNGLDIRFQETAESLASEPYHFTLTRATPPSVEGADQKIVITNYNELFKNLYQISTDNGATWSDVSVTEVEDAVRDVTTAEITGLTNGTKYSVNVKYGGHVLGSLEYRDATPRANKTALAAAIAAADADYNTEIRVSPDGKDVMPTIWWVTSGERDALQTAIGTAQGVYDQVDATQAQVDAATEAVKAAQQTYDEAKKLGRYVDKELLKEAIDAAQDEYDDQDTKVSDDGKDVPPDEQWVDPTEKGALKDAIDEAQGVYDDPDATAEDVEQAIRDINQAVEDFNNAKEPGNMSDDVDKSGLEESIQRAEEKEQGVEESGDGSDVPPDKTWVTPEDKQKLDEEIEKAKDVLNDPDATQEEVDQAKETLDQAIEEFDPKPGTKPSGGNTGTSGGNPGVIIVNKGDKDDEHKKHYVDLDDHWAEEDAYFVSDKDIFNGTDETHFSPNIPMNRAMMATVIYRMHGSPAASGTVTFRDVDMDTWYTDAIIWGNHAKTVVVKGYSAEAFGPEDPITREQLAAMLYRYADLMGLVQGSVPALTYVDSDEVSDWAYEAVAWMTDNGLLIGRENNRVDPLANATRAEVATVLARFVRFCEK